MPPDTPRKIAPLALILAPLALKEPPYFSSKGVGMSEREK